VMRPPLIVALLLSLPALAEGALDLRALRLVPARPAQAAAHEAVTGQLNPSRLLPLGFEVGGRLAVSRVSRGDVVKAGQALGSLDTEIIDAQVAQAEAGVMAAEAGATLAQDVAGRNQTLLAEGSVSDVQSRQLTTQAKAAQAQLAQARGALAQARAGQRRHYLFAPFPAAVIEAPDNVGGMVGPGMPVYILMSVDALLLKATVPEAVRGQLKPGLKVRVEAVGSSAFTAEGVLKAVLASADPQTRRVPVEILVPNGDGRFVANTLARAIIPLGEGRPAVTVPLTALGTSGGDHLFAVDASGTLRRVAVTVMDRQPTTVTVAPEQPVTQVVDYPTPGLVDGSRVPQRDRDARP
jgi:membrane fusion protein, multidrug efflux system